jgi:hypothetical protein
MLPKIYIFNQFPSNYSKNHFQFVSSRPKEGQPMYFFLNQSNLQALRTQRQRHSSSLRSSIFPADDASDGRGLVADGASLARASCRRGPASPAPRGRSNVRGARSAAPALLRSFAASAIRYSISASQPKLKHKPL